MAICNIAEDPAQSAEQFERIQAHLRRTGPVPPEGARLVLAGQANPGRRVITVWDSREARDSFFAERLGPAYASAGLGRKIAMPFQPGGIAKPIDLWRKPAP